MQIRLKGLTFIECCIAGVIVLLFLIVILPVFSRDEAIFRHENLETNLTQLRQQVEVYRRDHGGNLPSGDKFEAQMTLRTNANGDVCPFGASQDKYPFGPYIKQIPANPYSSTRVGNRVSAGIGNRGTSGWVYNPQTGEITAGLSGITN